MKYLTQYGQVRYDNLVKHKEILSYNVYKDYVNDTNRGYSPVSIRSDMMAAADNRVRTDSATCSRASSQVSL